MGKRGKNQKTGSQNLKKVELGENDGLEEMDDEIDVFHKQRDKISLDINDDFGDSDEDDALPVFDYKGIGGEDEENEDDEEEDDEDDDDDPISLVKKITTTQKLLKAKHGDLGDDMLEDSEDKEVERTVWSRRKSSLYGGDNVDYELQLSDEDSAQEEEAEVIRLRKEAAKSMTVEDLGIEDNEKDESDEEPTMEEMLIKGKDASGSSQKKGMEDDVSVPYEMVKKDLSSLSRDEQMDVVYSSAPELVGLLSELNDALEQLEKSVNPLLTKVQYDPTKKEGLHYLEVKKVLLLVYCQAITFYLLLKSEGQPVRDHPVIARLVEIKSLLDKLKELDVNLPPQFEEFLEENKNKIATKSAVKISTLLSDVVSEMKDREQASAMGLEASKLERKHPQQMKVSEDNVQKAKDIQTQNKKPVSSQSLKMLSARAALEEKLKQKGVFTAIEPSTQGTRKRNLQPLNGKLETFGDFDDDAMDAEENPLEFYGSALTLSNRVSQYLTAKGNKTKVSGDEDLPKRDDLGERRRKYELQVLARAGVKSTDKEDNNEGEPAASEDDKGRNNEDVGSDESDESEDEFYKQVKQKRNQRLAAKAKKYSRTPVLPQGPELTVDGRRHITTKIEKNRGLTRKRKKLTKNPRKKYKLKHEKVKKRRAGQVRQIMKPEGPYSGETSGINANISRSIRLSG